MGDAAHPVILLTGAAGLVGDELSRVLSPLGSVHACDRATLDLADFDAIQATIRATRPDVIVNAAAYTNVDLAERDRDLATRINAEAPGVLAAEAARIGAVLVHYSTDYVFDGACDRPYSETDPVAPINEYGRGKAAGDSAILDSAAAAYIFRIAWVYGARGKNFLTTVQRLAVECNELRIVSDQYGGPTWSRTIAQATMNALAVILGSRTDGRDPPPHGVYHMAPPDWTNRSAFAEAIVQAGSSPERPAPVVVPVASSAYLTPARRPAWSVLDSSKLQREFGLTLPPWREQLVRCLGA